MPMSSDNFSMNKVFIIRFQKRKIFVQWNACWKKEIYMTENLPTQTLHPLDMCHANLR